jgi:glycerophosphoryl diester phosphodiesterase
MEYKIQIPRVLKRDDRPIILAHRGCRAHAPENTLAAFRLALAQGADIIETDLRITRDGVIVCIHDATVDRTTEGSGRVDQLPWAEIKQFKARGKNEQSYPEARVPALAEVLETLADRTYFAVELKAPVFTQPADVENLLETLEQYHALDRVLAISFSRQALACVEAVGAPIPLAHITLFNPWPSARYPLVGPWWPLLYINPFYVAISHKRGQICCPLDPTPEPRLPFYLRLGVDALLSDDPEVTLQALATLTNR